MILKKITLLALLLCINYKAYSLQSRLSTLALGHLSDKGPHANNYTEIYEHYFGSLQNASINFLEIGRDLEGFYARKMWDNYFTHPETQLHFIDPSFNVKSYSNDLSNRCFLHVLDQSNITHLSNFAKDAPCFDIIIDDGLHTIHQQLISFQILFKSLKPGGMYIIEDLLTSYPKEPNTISKAIKALEPSTVNFLKNLVDDINYAPTLVTSHFAQERQWPISIQNSLSTYQATIESIHFLL